MQELLAWFLIAGLMSFQIMYSDAQPAVVNVIENGANGDGKTDSTRVHFTYVSFIVAVPPSYIDYL